MADCILQPYICNHKDKITQKMIIEKQLLEKWSALRSPEDTKKLSDKMEGGYPELFSRVFREGKCNDEVFKVMADYYEEKAALIKQYL